MRSCFSPPDPDVNEIIEFLIPPFSRRGNAGEPPYRYQLADPYAGVLVDVPYTTDTTYTFSNLAAGTWVVRMIDSFEGDLYAGGGSSGHQEHMATVTVATHPAITATSQLVSDDSGAADGAVTFTLAGPVPTSLQLDGLSVPSEVLTNLAAGKHVFTAIDSNGCVYDFDFEVFQVCTPKKQTSHPSSFAFLLTCSPAQSLSVLPRSLLLVVTRVVSKSAQQEVSCRTNTLSSP